MAGLPVEPLNAPAQDDTPLVTRITNRLKDFANLEKDTTSVLKDAGSYKRITDRLFGTGGEERYQTWPEKMIRDALSAPHDVIAAGTAPNPYSEGTEEHQDFESRRTAAIPQALSMAALAGTGGLAGAGEAAGTALGAGPFLRPALKFKDKLYKAPAGGQHLDALPQDMIPEFNRLAMSGEDISHYNFGFMNHKGQFLSREKALQYAIDEGLLHPNSEAARAGVLTSTMDLMADSSKPGTAIQLLKSKSGDGRFHINDTDGNEIGRLALSQRNGGKDLYIDNIDTPNGANSLGYSSLNDLKTQLKAMYPDAERIGGYRAGGARSKAEEIWQDLKKD